MKLFGKLHNLWTLPLAILIAVFQNYISTVLGWFSMTPEKIMKVIPALVVFLLVETLVRLYYIVQYPNTYFYAEINHKKNQGWKNSSEEQRFKYSFWQRIAYLVVFALILFAM